MTDRQFVLNFDRRPMLERALQYDTDNPQVYRQLVVYAFQMLHAKRTRGSIDLLFQRLRWYTTVETQSEDDFKLNDQYRAYYARKLMAEYPELAGFFELRSSQFDQLFPALQPGTRGTA